LEPECYLADLKNATVFVNILVSFAIETGADGWECTLLLPKRESIMGKHAAPAYHNNLLAALGAVDLALLEPHLEQVKLSLRDILEVPGEAIPFVYFPQSGIVSFVATFGVRRDIEVGLTGRDGMTGTALLQLDTQSPYTAMVRLDGHAVRLASAHLVAALDRNPPLRALLTRYARSFGIQVSYTAVANGSSLLAERLARWLLMVHDRVVGDRLALTHDYIAVMLGVRRLGVTEALHILEGKGLIRSNRGEVVIRDRDGLAAEAGGGYGQPEAEYSRVTGIPLGKMSDGSTASSADADLPEVRPTS
jgi:CRP-like cAMP-binding protein